MNRARTRAGIALVFVLGVLLILLAGLTVWLSAAARAGAAGTAWSTDAELRALEQGGEALALAWLVKNGATLVAPPEGGSWTIVADRWTTPSASGWLQVTVYDGWAGIPPHLAGPRGSLRRVLPWFLASSEFPATIGISERPSTPSDLLAVIDLPPGARRFPPPHPAPSLSADAWRTPGVEVARLSVIASAPPEVPSLATALSPHSDGRINLNTAPLPLVELVIRLQGALIPADLRRNRLRGIPTMPPPDNGGTVGRAQLVATSGVWNLHITASVDGWTRSWWVVVSGSSADARIVQRHACPP